ncbi:MAG TPA: helix-turn-helix domain-containing protein, partial [Ktedonobacterales bacterium]|nr:helix-turn-helix domain-containing protein [Ktedonobacterales bacterium]
MGASTQNSFGNMLRRFRLGAGMTQGALAERAGMSERAINDLERTPGRTPRLQTITLLAEALGLSPADRERLLAAARPTTLTHDPLPAAPFFSSAPQTAVATSQPDAAQPALVLAPPPLHIGPPPTPPDEFIGRAGEVAEVRARLREPGLRLLTLTGPGGIGKTRLALQVIEGLDGRFPDGVCFVALGDLTDPALVLPTIAAALGLHESAWQAPLAQVIEALRERRVLLVLDNFEQVTPAAVDVEHVLAECPLLTALVTSRTPLHLAREREYPVPPLALPDFASGASLARYLACDSVALLLQCARAVQPDFAVTEANADTLAAICRKVDGVPLAIRLAAARLKHVPSTALLARLDQQLAVLTGGPRDAPIRQHTVRATLDWSFQLLSTEQRTLLRRLSVFAGGWTLEAAEAVCAGDGVAREDVLDVLGSLVDQSLVLVADHDGAARYRLLELVRQYAAEQVREAGEETATRDRHLAWCLALAERDAAETWIITPWPLMHLLRP